MNYFLAKTDPETYSTADFEREGTTLWDGVHSNAAILVIQQMRPGDRVYIYESQSTKAIVGLAEVLDEPHDNPDDPRRSDVVHMKFLQHTKPLGLSDFKADPAMANFDLVRQSRLSTMAVPDYMVKWINERLNLT